MEKRNDAAKESLPRVSTIARSISSKLLAEIPLSHLQKGLPVPLEDLAGKLGITIREGAQGAQGALSDLKHLGLEGAVRRSSSEDYEEKFEWSRPDYEINVMSQGFRARFTLAHELAHVVLAEQFREVDTTLSTTERESVCDRVARQLLLPVEIMKSSFQMMARSRLELDKIERISLRLKVSLSVLINRLRELVYDRLLVLPGVVILATLDRSRKRHDNLAPRVATACGPNRWFIPTNVRLSSIGLTGLQSAFHSAPMYQVGRLTEELRTWDYLSGRRSRARCEVEFKCYRWAMSRSTTAESRVMLATLHFDEPQS